jgi:hypothetical protein
MSNPQKKRFKADFQILIFLFNLEALCSFPAIEIELCLSDISLAYRKKLFLLNNSSILIIPQGLKCPKYQEFQDLIGTIQLDSLTIHSVVVIFQNVEFSILTSYTFF